MNKNLKKYAPFGLYLSLLAALAAGGLYILKQSFDLSVQISLAFIVVGLALYALIDPSRTRELITGRQVRYGSNALILTIAIVGILVVANILASKVNKTWDLTEDKQNTLSEESVTALKSLKAPVKAEAYFTSRIPTDTARTLLENYKNASGGNFDYEFIDPETNPVRATAAKVTRDSTIVLVEGARSEQISYASEQEITNGLIRLDNPGNRKVYFLIGHDEYSPDDTTGTRSYSSAKQILENKNYTVATLNLIADRKIPEDATAIVIAGSVKPLAPEEVELIKAYLEKGGGLVFLSEPPIVTQTGEQVDPMAAYLANAYSISMGNDLVIEPNYNPPFVAVSASYGQHAITSKMYNQVSILPTSRSVLPSAADIPNITATALILTSQNSWGETSQQELNDNQLKFDDGVDTVGPVSIAVAAENTDNLSRIVVFGDSDFGGNQYFGQYGNSDMLMNAIDWAAKQDNLINLTAKQSTSRILVLNNDMTMGLILLGTVFGIPGAFVATGIVVWARRRRKG
jgi:ABC-type uncharacterized transport system involved in gliding motility auxiliary subunit